ncbi:hypothetical protein [Candidatus Rariloculus sp.]|uniref:hypothetical protein n=1 Tax=Candidatus Rariloculus sp. TaxID=3101265 RepID=UPI003D10CC12
MVERPLWLKRLETAWSRRSIVWLSGVRRVGKTTLARMLPDAEYFNCDLPSTRLALADPELLLDQRPAAGPHPKRGLDISRQSDPRRPRRVC